MGAGLIYTYTKGTGLTDPWYWTALDFRTGRVVYERLSGTGSINYNNNYAGIAIARSSREYVGTLDGDRFGARRLTAACWGDGARR